MNVAIDVAEAIAQVLDGGLPCNAVNMIAIAPEIMEKLALYLQLGEKLGSFLLKRPRHKPLAGHLQRALGCQTGPITTSILKGMLERIVDDHVNLVNAEYLAKRRGIKVETIHRGNGEDYHNRIGVQVETAEGTFTVAGSVFQPDSPRMVEINGYRLDLVPSGYLLVAPHQDQPGIIGQVGTIMGKAELTLLLCRLGARSKAVKL